MIRIDELLPWNWTEIQVNPKMMCDSATLTTRMNGDIKRTIPTAFSQLFPLRIREVGSCHRVLCDSRSR